MELPTASASKVNLNNTLLGLHLVLTVLPDSINSASKDLLNSTLQDPLVLPTSLHQALRLSLNNIKLPHLVSFRLVDVPRELFKLKMLQDTNTTSLRVDSEATPTMDRLSSTVLRTEHHLALRDSPDLVDIMLFLQQPPVVRDLLEPALTSRVLINLRHRPTLRALLLLLVPMVLQVPRVSNLLAPMAKLLSAPLLSLTLHSALLLEASHRLDLPLMVLPDPRFLVLMDKASVDPKVRLQLPALCQMQAMNTTVHLETLNSVPLLRMETLRSVDSLRMPSSLLTKAYQASLEAPVLHQASAKKKDTNTETKGG